MEARIKGLGENRLNSSEPLNIPSSKSHTIRALLIASMAAGESRLLNPLNSADAHSCAEACRAFGAVIDMNGRTADGRALWTVTGNSGTFPWKISPIDVGNSGTTLYLASGLAALADTAVHFTGDEQIQSRPAEPLLASLSDLGASVIISGKNGSPPFSITGPLRGGRTPIECPTSQYLSSLLICAPLASGDSLIEVPLLMEKPYVEMTLRWLDRQGIEYINEGFRSFRVPGGQRYRSFEAEIPGDFSSAAFPLCAAAVTGSRLSIGGLDITDSQGDKAVLDYLEQMGCLVEIENPSGPGIISVTGPGHPDNPASRLRGAELDLNDTPDALPAMAAAACFAEGDIRLYNVPQARLKETDRISVMRQELTKLGASIEEFEDGMLIHGNPARPLRGFRVSGHGDHRVVMSLAVAALAAEGETVISDAEAVDITYPGFFDQLESITR